MAKHHFERVTALAIGMRKTDVAAIAVGDKDENAYQFFEMLHGKNVGCKYYYFHVNGSIADLQEKWLWCRR